MALFADSFFLAEGGEFFSPFFYMRNFIFVLTLLSPVVCFAGHGQLIDDGGYSVGDPDPGWYIGGGSEEPESSGSSAAVQIDESIRAISFGSALASVGVKVAQGLAFAFGLAGALLTIQLVRRVIFQCGRGNSNNSIELDYYRDLERTREYNRGPKMELTPEERAIIYGEK